MQSVTFYKIVVSLDELLCWLTLFTAANVKSLKCKQIKACLFWMCSSDREQKAGGRPPCFRKQCFIFQKIYQNRCNLMWNKMSGITHYFWLCIVANKSKLNFCATADLKWYHMYLDFVKLSDNRMAVSIVYIIYNKLEIASYKYGLFVLLFVNMCNCYSWCRFGPNIETFGPVFFVIWC